MSQPTTFMQRLGFDSDRLRFAMITACASILALFIAEYAGLAHPQWAAMTVWASAQPWRENLLEKSWWRFAGTVSGVLAGVMLIQLHQISPLLFVISLAGWLGACSGIGQLQKGFVAYGTFLAGYSAVMVSMLSVHATNNLFFVAWDRFWTILVGVLCAIVFNFLFTPKREQTAIIALKQKIDTQFYTILHRSLYKKEPIAKHEIDTLWQQMTTYDEQLEANRIGWRYHRKQVAKARQQLFFQSQILLQLEHVKNIAAFPFPKIQPTEQQWKHILSVCPNGVLKNLLIPLFYVSKGVSIKAHYRVDKLKLHHDRISAWQAFARAFVTIATVGFLWLVTQWQALAYLTLGLSVMIALFASLDYPAKFMKNIFTGQSLGAIAALICTWCLWPFASSSWQMSVFIVPVIISGIFVFAHSKLILIAFDYIMVSLILLQPSYPFTLSFPESLGNAIAIVCGPLVAMGAFYWIYPTNPKKRYQNLILLSEQQFKLGLNKIITGQKPSTSQMSHRLFSGLILARKNDASFEKTLQFFAIRHGIWLNLMQVYKQFSACESHKRALKGLVLHLQRPHPDAVKIHRFTQRLRRKAKNSGELCLLLDKVQLYLHNLNANN
ncbi:TPA: FUSC family protein [Providencia alcalifaciens]